MTDATKLMLGDVVIAELSEHEAIHLRILTEKAAGPARLSQPMVVSMQRDKRPVTLTQDIQTLQWDVTMELRFYDSNGLVYAP